MLKLIEVFTYWAWTHQTKFKMASSIKAVDMCLDRTGSTLVENCDIVDLCATKNEQICVSTKVIHCGSVKLASLMKKERRKFAIIWSRM